MHARACLDATGDPDQLLRDALGAKKLKELRRQRNRLADHGDIVFHAARTPDEVAQALETFLALEMSGWKGERGTALAQDAGDAAFIRSATIALAAHEDTAYFCRAARLRSFAAVRSSAGKNVSTASSDKVMSTGVPKIIVVDMQMAFLSPPFGYSLFYLKSVAPPQISMATIFKAAVNFMVLQWIGVGLCIIFPQIVLWLPSILYAR